MKKAFIIDGIRTPVGKFRGSLAGMRADDMAALVIKKLLERNPVVDPGEIEDVIFGCANQAGEDNRNVARMAGLLAGLPVDVPGETVNRLCASGMSAVVTASRAVQTENGDLFIAGGVENMTRAPMVMSKSDKSWGGNAEIYDTTLGWRFPNPRMKEIYGAEAMGETAENIVERYGISREDQDKFALWSQRKAALATENGRLAKEIIPVEITVKKGDNIVFSNDEFVKPSTTNEILAKLKPAFRKGGSVTAGNSSGLNDGAAALLIASEKAIENYSLKPAAEIISSAVVGVEPRLMGMGPVGATRKALKRAGLSLRDMDVIELNEAFASQSLACVRELGLDDYDPRINPNGGAIAIGHPLGMSGARLLLTAMKELEEKNKEFALCTMCVGVGQGMATIIKRV